MPYYIWTTLRTMPPISFPIFPSLNAICPASLYLYCVFNYQLFKHSAAAWHDVFHIISSFNQSVACQMASVTWHDQHHPRSITVLRCFGLSDRLWPIDSSKRIKKKWRSGAEVKIEQRKIKEKEKKKKNSTPKESKMLCDAHQKEKKKREKGMLL